MRTVQDPRVYRQAIVVLTGRYNILGWTSLGVLAVTGTFNALERISPPMAEDLLFGTRYGRVLVVKVLLFLGIVALTAVHSFIIGPRMLAYPPEANASTDPQFRRLQRLSGAISSLNLLFTLLILVCVILLRG